MDEEGGQGQLGLGTPGSSPLRAGGEIVYSFSPPPLPTPKGFPFLVCETKEGNLGKGCGQASTHTPNIPLPTFLSSVWGEADPGKWVILPPSPVSSC